MIRLSRSVALVVLSLVLAGTVFGCGAKASPSAASRPSGVTGACWVAGGAPLPDASGTTPASTPRPLTGTVVVHEGSDTGRVATRVETDGDGRFKVDLPPGTYVLTMDNGAFAAVTVKAGSYVKADVTKQVP